MMKIWLHGKFSDRCALVDNEDYPYLNQFKWYLSHGYATSVIHRKGSSRVDIDRSINLSMTKIIANRANILTDEFPWPDHEDGNRLNNQRYNLRASNTSHNSWNLQCHRNPSDTLGIRHRSDCDAWVVHVGIRRFGQYKDKRVAELVYDRVALSIRGSYAVIKHPECLDELPEDFLIPGFNTEPKRAMFKSTEHGVSWFKPKNKWRVIIRQKTLGYFDTEEEAIKFRRSLP